MNIAGARCVNRKKSRMAGEVKDNAQLLLLMLPGLIKIFIFSYLPMYGVVLAFKSIDYSGSVFSSPWVGFKNFEFFFKSIDAFRITYNTVFMNALFIAAGTLTSIFLALMLYKLSNTRRIMKCYQVIMFFPHFLSWVVVATILTTVIGTNGFIQGFIEALGHEKIMFYQESKYWPVILTVVHIWKSAGYSCIVYYAMLIGMDSSQYEAAKIDGANEWHIMTKIQVPYLTPMIVLNVLMAIGNIFRADFGMFYFLPGAGNTLTLHATEVIDTYVYRAMRNLGDISMSSAVGLYQSFVGMILITMANKVAKKIDPDYGIF